MRAAVLHAPGPPSAFSIEEIPKPLPGRGDVVAQRLREGPRTQLAEDHERIGEIPQRDGFDLHAQGGEDAAALLRHDGDCVGHVPELEVGEFEGGQGREAHHLEAVFHDEANMSHPRLHLLTGFA